MSIKWKEQFIREGVFSLTDDDVRFIAKFQQVYVENYLPIAQEAVAKIKKPKKLPQQLLKDVQTVIKYLGMLLDPRLQDEGARRILDELDGLFERVEENLKKVGDVKIIGKKRVEELQTATGKNIKELASTHKILSRKFAVLGPETLGVQIGKAALRGAAPLGGVVREIGAGLATAMLGPFMPIVDILGRSVAGIARNIFQTIREHREKVLRGRLARAGATPAMWEILAKAQGRGLPVERAFYAAEVPNVPLAAEAQPVMPKVYAVGAKGRKEALPPDLVRRLAEQGRIEAGPARRRVAGAAPVGLATVGMPQVEVGVLRGKELKNVVMPVGRAISQVGILRGKELKNAAMPVWYFFDKLAYRAKWTKEVLKVLRGNVGGAGGIGGFLAGLFGGSLLTWARQFFLVTLPRFLMKGLTMLTSTLAGQVLLVIGAALAGWKIGKLLLKWFPQFDKFLGDLFWRMYQGWVGFVDRIRAGFGKLVTNIKNGFISAITFVKDLFVGYIQFQINIWLKVRDFIIGGLKTAFDFVFGIAAKIGGFIQSVISKITGLMKYPPFNWIGKGVQRVKELATPTGTIAKEVIKETVTKVAELPKVIKQTFEKVPVVVETKEIGEKLGAFAEKITKSMSEMISNLQKAVPQPQPVTRPGSDYVYNIRDPLVENLNSGMISLEE